MAIRTSSARPPGHISSRSSTRDALSPTSIRIDNSPLANSGGRRARSSSRTRSSATLILTSLSSSADATQTGKELIFHLLEAFVHCFRRGKHRTRHGVRSLTRVEIYRGGPRRGANRRLRRWFWALSRIPFVQSVERSSGVYILNKGRDVIVFGIGAKERRARNTFSVVSTTTCTSFTASASGVCVSMAKAA